MASPMASTLWLYGPVTLVVLALGHRAAARLQGPPRAWAGVATVLALPPCLVLGVLMGSAFARWLSPATGITAIAAFVVPALLLVALLWPITPERVAAMTRAQAITVVAALALLTVPNGALLVFAISAGEPQQADHAWTVTVAPDEQDLAYTLRVPFVVPAGERAERPLALLTEALAVKEGTASIEVDSANGWLVIEARGPVEVSAQVRFFGTTGHREAFFDYRLPSYNVTLTSEGTLAADVLVTADLSGGEGHTCWLRFEATAEVTTAAPVPLVAGDGEDGFGRDGQLPGGVCA